MRVVWLMFLIALINIAQSDRVRRKVRSEYGILMVRDTKYLLQPDGWEDIVLSLDRPNLETITAEVKFNPCAGLFSNLDKLHFCDKIENFIINAANMEKQQRSRLAFVREEIKLLMSTPIDKIRERFRKSLIPIIGEIGRKLFGWATLRDISNLATGLIRSNGYFEDSIQKLKNGTLNFVKRFGQEMILVKATLQNMALDIANSFKAVNEREENLSNETQKLRAEALWESFVTIYFHMRFFNIHIIQQDIEEATKWKEGWMDLQNGKISTNFVSVNEMVNIRQNVIKSLRQKGRKVCMKDINFWYNDVLESFEYTADKLYLYLRIPYSRESCHYHLFHVTKWQVPMGHGGTGYNEIMNVPEILGVRADEKFYMTLTGYQLRTCIGRFTWHCEELFMAHKFTQPSCIWGLWNQDTKITSHECKYKAKPFKRLQIWAKSIMPNQYVVRNPGNGLVRRNLATGREQRVNCTYCMVKVACGEEYIVGDWTMKNNGQCGMISYKIKEIVNKPLMEAFNVSISSENFETYKTHVQLPEFRKYYNESDDFEKDLHDLAREMKQGPHRKALNERNIQRYVNDGGWGYTVICAYIVAILASFPGIFALYRQRKVLGPLALLKGIPRVSSHSIPLLSNKKDSSDMEGSMDFTWYYTAIVLLLSLLLFLKIWDSFKASSFWKKQRIVSKDMLEPVGMRFGIKIGLMENWIKLPLMEIMELPDFYTRFKINGSFSFSIIFDFCSTFFYLEGPHSITCSNMLGSSEYIWPARYSITKAQGDFLESLAGKDFKVVYYLEKYGKYFTIKVESKKSKEELFSREFCEDDTRGAAKLGGNGFDSDLEIERKGDGKNNIRAKGRARVGKGPRAPRTAAAFVFREDLPTIPPPSVSLDPDRMYRFNMFPDPYRNDFA